MKKVIHCINVSERGPHSDLSLISDTSEFIAKMSAWTVDSHLDQALLCSDGKPAGLWRRILFMQLVIILLITRPQVSCTTSKCTITEPFPFLYRYLQPGSAIIGGITSQITKHFELHDFLHHPHHTETSVTL